MLKLDQPRLHNTFSAAPSGLHGWPWQLPDTEQEPDSSLPKISVITPSFNQGQFIEQTIRSVLLQGYPDLEYIIIDGGSSDRTLDVIRKYDRYISYWVSEKDRGQSHAINKGLARSTGQVLCWLNSDDYYLPRALTAVGEMLKNGTGVYALAGHCLKVYQDGTPAVKLESNYVNRRRLLQFWKGYQMHQPAIFWRREVFEKTGMLDESLHLIMDFDYWARIARHFHFQNVDQVLACCNYHEAAKTGDEYSQYHFDLKKYAHRYWSSRLSPEFWRLQLSMTNHFNFQPAFKNARELVKRYSDPRLKRKSNLTRPVEAGKKK